MLAGMSNTPTHIALCQAQALPEVSGAPEWIHLIPAGQVLRTGDQRGPYRVSDPAAIVAASTGKLPIDENHAIDLAAPRGEASPARGYIVELQSRDDGIWGRTEWTEAGRALVADKAYLGISPVIIHDGQKNVLRIARASLTNRPNLQGLTALHHQETTPMTTAVAKALGLADDAGEEQILSAIGKLTPQVALQSQLGEIGLALGVAEGAGADAIVAAAKAKGTAQPAEITALQSQLAEVTTKLNKITSDTAREKAEAFVDAAIREGRVGVKPLRDRYIALHMRDPEEAQALIGAMPTIGGEIPDTRIALQSEQSASDLVSKARAFQAKQHAAGHGISWAEAVHAVNGGAE